MVVRVGLPIQSYSPYYDSCAAKSGWYKTKNCPTPGASVEILRELLRIANVSVEYDLLPTDDYGVKINEFSWTGIFGLIMNETFATTIFDFIVTKERFESFDFSTSIIFTPYAFYYKLADDSFKTYASPLFKPFNKVLWSLIWAVAFMLLAIWIFVPTDKTKICFKKLLLRKTFVFIQFLQGDFDRNLLNFTAPKMFFFISLSIFTIFFSTLYQGVLLVGFIKGKDPNHVSTLAELIHLLENKHLRIITDDDDWGFFAKVQSSEGDLFKKLNSIFSNNMYLTVKSQDEVYEHLMTGKYVYPVYATDVQKRKGWCGLGLMILDEGAYPNSFVFRKNSSLVPRINDAISRSWNMINYYSNYYNLLAFSSLGNRIDDIFCTKNTEKASSIFDLTIYQFSGHFIVLFIGCLLGIFFFIFENFKQK